MVKTLKNLLLWNQKADNLESRYATLGTWILTSLFNWWPWVDLDLCYGNVKFCPLCPYVVWEKGKTMDFSETIVVCDHKVNRWSQLNEYMKLYEYQRSRSFIDLGPNLSDSVFLNFFSSVTTAKFHVESPWDGGMKAFFTWSRWPPSPYMVKSFKNLLLWNLKADNLETWFAASHTRVLPSLFKWCLRVDLDLSYGKVKFSSLLCRKKLKRWISQKLL